MTQPSVIVFDEHQGQHVGIQVKVILEQESVCRVHLIDAPLVYVSDVLPSVPDLVIPVLSASKNLAERLSQLSMLEARAPFLPVIGLDELDATLKEVSSQFHDFLVTPLRPAEVRARVRLLLSRSGGQERSDGKGTGVEAFGSKLLIGEDSAFTDVKRRITLIAQSDSPVLITGETGTGKEMCARALHYLSQRSGRPFLPVNCGAIPVELFENELFGHQKGAFTNAWTAQSGLITEAEGGTLFLDEIETLSLPAQAKLLRFVQDQTYYVVGSPKIKRANVWIIASTNVDLLGKVHDGAFREDLFYRLAVMTLALPPLRQRPLDIPLLTAHFLKRHAKPPGLDQRQLSPRAMDAFCSYSWPGNIRQLENVVRQLIVLVEAPTIEPEHLPIPLELISIRSRNSSFQNAKVAAIEEFEKTYIAELLRIHQGNVTLAARDAKKERRTFGRLIKKYQISKH